MGKSLFRRTRLLKNEELFELAIQEKEKRRMEESQNLPPLEALKKYKYLGKKTDAPTIDINELKETTVNANSINLILQKYFAFWSCLRIYKSKIEVDGGNGSAYSGTSFEDYILFDKDSSISVSFNDNINNLMNSKKEKPLKLNDLEEIVNTFYNEWKSLPPITNNYRICHNNCHGSCHCKRFH